MKHFRSGWNWSTLRNWPHFGFCKLMLSTAKFASSNYVHEVLLWDALSISYSRRKVVQPNGEQLKMKLTRILPVHWSQLFSVQRSQMQFSQAFLVVVPTKVSGFWKITKAFENTRNVLIYPLSIGLKTLRRKTREKVWSAVRFSGLVLHQISSFFLTLTNRSKKYDGDGKLRAGKMKQRESFFAYYFFLISFLNPRNFRKTRADFGWKLDCRGGKLFFTVKIIDLGTIISLTHLRHASA